MINPDVLKTLKFKLRGLNEEAFIEEILQTFLRLMPQRIAELQAASKINDFEQIKYVAHTAKSSAATIGAESLKGLFQRLESLAQSEKKTDIDQLVASLEPLFAQTEKELLALRTEL